MTEELKQAQAQAEARGDELVAAPQAGEAEQPVPRTDVVPGKVHCSACGFTLFRTNLYVNSGTTGPGDERIESCPNDGNTLLPVTWEQEAREAWKTCEQMFDRAVAAEAKLTSQPMSREGMNEAVEGPATGLMHVIDGYAKATRAGDRGACMALRQVLQESIEQMADARGIGSDN